MKFYRIARAQFDTPELAFSGLGATKASHRWNWASPSLRAVYCSDSLALACLETLVHIRPLPRLLPASVYFIAEIPDELLERPDTSTLPAGWSDQVPSAETRDFGTEFLRSRRNVGLVIPTVIQEEGLNVVINPLHHAFALRWIKGPFPYSYDRRLT